MIDCPEFLARYSDYRDRLLEPLEDERFARHLARCESCARYDRVIDGGIRTLLALPEVSPGPDFLDRLDDRLSGGATAGARSGSGTPVSLVVAVAVAIGAAAWLPALRPDTEPLRLPAAAAHAPYHPQHLPLVYHPGLLPAPAANVSRPALPRSPANFSPYSLLGTPPARSQPMVTRTAR